jgi:hypothetical protein
MTPYEKKYANDDDSTELTVATTTTTGTSSTVKRKRSLRFSLASNQSFPIPHISDLDDEEVAAVWYEKKGYDAIKSKTISTLRKMMKREEIEENNRHCVRGLEYLTLKGAQQRQHNKRQAVTAVLNEQKRQRDEGLQDDELLSEAFRNASSHCQDAACAIGLEDEAEIKKQLETMKSETNCQDEACAIGLEDEVEIKTELDTTRSETNRLTSSNLNTSGSKTSSTSGSKKSCVIDSLLKQISLLRLPLREPKKRVTRATAC